MTFAESMRLYADLLRRRAERPELFQRLPGRWRCGLRGGPSWFTTADHVRTLAPRFYARPVTLGVADGVARFHFAQGDPRLRAITIVSDPIFAADAVSADRLAGILNAVAEVTADLDRRGFLDCEITGALHAVEGGTQIVIDLLPWADLAADPGPAPSMEEFFIWD
jgi:hypothetical protein